MSTGYFSTEIWFNYIYNLWRNLVYFLIINESRRNSYLKDCNILFIFWKKILKIEAKVWRGETLPWQMAGTFQTYPPIAGPSKQLDNGSATLGRLAIVPKWEIFSPSWHVHIIFLWGVLYSRWNVSWYIWTQILLQTTSKPFRQILGKGQWDLTFIPIVAWLFSVRIIRIAML